MKEVEMLLRRISIPIVLILSMLLQFVPGTAFSPGLVAASSCDVAKFVADATIPDGTIVAPGTSFVKTWRLKNVGSCTWTTSYSAVFTGGDQMGAPAVVNLPYSVAPGATVDISVNLVAPTGNGHYRGNWKLRNASGTLFGVGASGNYLFWVDIYVNTSSTTGTTYDFVTNYCSALWASGAGGLACPGVDGNVNGFVLKVDAPQLETGSVSPNPALVVNPQQVAGGFIKGYYPAYTVQAGDHFQSIINCAYGATNCYVNFKLQYQINGGAVQTLWSFNERYEGLYYPVNLDLSSLAGQSVNFILYVADVSGHGTPSGDRAAWVGPKITGSSSIPNPPIPPSLTCDKGAFVGDVTIPDGSVVAPGATFTKTWRIRNVGSCTWTTDYALIFAFGNQMGAPGAVNLPSGVAPVVPGATADFSVNLVAPSTPGHYRSYWRFRNASGVQFGVGSGNVTFFADINVSGLGLTPTTTTITVDNPDPSTPGQSVLVGASVTGSGSTPTGTVAISGADTNCTMTLSSGSGSCSVVFNSAGAKTLVATYSGDGTNAASSDSDSHTVSAAGPFSTTTITGDNPDPSIPGQSVAVSVSVTGSGSTPTGTVSITGADSNCTITLASGTGSCNVLFNTVGAKVVSATYNGDGTHPTSSTTANHAVSTTGNASTTTFTADSPDPSTPGQSVAVTVSVTGSGSTPTGTVAITGADNNCTVTLSGGSGSCNVVFNTTGHKTLSALYSGNGVFAGSSDTEAHEVVTTTALTTTIITADTPDPSVPGQVVDVEVSVSGSGTYPTGTVAITGADTNCTLTLTSDGTGNCDVIFNTTGAKTLTAVYSGNSNYAGSSDTESHSVTTGKAATATSITDDIPDPSIPGQAVVVSVTVSGAGLPAPSGTVAVTGADTNCSILLAGGTGSCSVVFNSTGHKTITATYSGDGTYDSSSGSVGHTVNKGSTTTTIIDHTPDPSIPGQPVEVTFSVFGGGVTPTGIVSITGAEVNCNITLSGGSSSCNVIFNTIGIKTITATYSGDANYLPSSATTTHTVKNSTTAAIISDNADPSLPGDNVLVTVTITGTGAITPTGTVDITGADTNCSIGALATIGVGIGSGSCTVTFNTAGAKLLTAKYSGDANYVGSSTTTSHTVNKGPTTTTITNVTPDPSLANQTVTVTVMVTGAAVIPTGSVAITISGQPSTCTINLLGGTGQCNIVFTSVGTFTMTATYSGDGNYLVSSFVISHIVN
jgi:large repetitive protein